MSNKLNIVLFGPPGAGKGTQSEYLISHYGLVHLSTGDLLRAEIQANSPLGQQAQALMSEGLLVPDDIVIGMISNKLDASNSAKGFIFDGFPRTKGQAEALDGLLEGRGEAITVMLALEVPEAELVKRLLARGANSGRPDDKNEDVIRKRIREYEEKTFPLKAFYQAQDKFKGIEGTGTIEEITGRLITAVGR
jgi:adenylate kinase